MSASAKRIAGILIFAAIVFLAGNARAPLWDRDEPRYAQCSRLMLQSDDWVVPRLYDKWRTQKPPFIYWCQAAAMKLLGDQGDTGAFAARLPSGVAMLATLSLLAIAISRQTGTRHAMWTIFVLATSVLPIFAAKICLTDSVLALFITGAQICLYLMWRGNRSWGVVILMAVLIGLGGLTKGPSAIGVVACTTIALVALRQFDRWRERREAQKLATGNSVESAESGPLSPVLGGGGWGEGPGVERGSHPKVLHVSSLAPASLVGAEQRDAGQSPLQPKTRQRDTQLISAAKIFVAIAIVAAIVLPWIFLVHHRAPGLLKMMFGEAGAHAIEGKEGHWAPPGFHFVVVWPMFMPWSLLLPLAMVMGFKHRKDPTLRFALAAVLGPWVMFELIGTKLPHYFLPAYPAMAFLVAFVIIRCLNGELKELAGKPFMIGAGVWAVAAGGAGLLPWFAAIWFRHLPWGAMVLLASFGMAYAVIVYTLLLKQKFAPAFVAMGIGMWIAAVIGVAVYVPQAQFMQISTHVAEVLRREGAIHPGDVRMVDYKEPSLGFYQGGTIREEQNEGLFNRQPLAQWPRWVVVSSEVYGRIPAEQKKGLRVVDRFRGWAYADKGRIEEVMVLANEGRK